jgi:hypothetical protein
MQQVVLHPALTAQSQEVFCMAFPLQKGTRLLLSGCSSPRSVGPTTYAVLLKDDNVPRSQSLHHQFDEIQLIQ